MSRVPLNYRKILKDSQLMRNFFLKPAGLDVPGCANLDSQFWATTQKDPHCEVCARLLRPPATQQVGRRQHTCFPDEPRSEQTRDPAILREAVWPEDQASQHSEIYGEGVSYEPGRLQEDCSKQEGLLEVAGQSRSILGQDRVILWNR